MTPIAIAVDRVIARFGHTARCTEVDYIGATLGGPALAGQSWLTLGAPDPRVVPRRSTSSGTRSATAA